MTMTIDPTLRAIADSTRLRIMRLLSAMELAVGELAQVLGQSQPRVSRHVRILCEAGLAERRKEGSWVFLRSAISEAGPTSLGSALAQLLAVAETEDAGFGELCGEDRRHLAAIRAGREGAAQAYFARHAAQWDQLRVMHGADEPVEAALAHALGVGGLGVSGGIGGGISGSDSPHLGAMLDIGTGTGRMADLFAPHATHVSAFDKSPEMLRIARARLQHLPAGTVDLVQGDFSALPFADARFDTVLFHQVLHYAQAPEQVLAEAARVTRVGGRIAIVDFAAHGREELRETHAHARLGFADEQMQSLLADAGFAAEPPVAVAGETLTVKIWTGRRVAASGSAGPTLSDKKAPQA